MKGLGGVAVRTICSGLSRRCQTFYSVKALSKASSSVGVLGDEVDGVPGLQNMAPGFGQKSALKLLKKHGSLQNLLNAAAVRTVGKQYAQDALIRKVDELDKTISVAAIDPSWYGIDEAELDKRRRWTSTASAQVKIRRR